jgi:hypothetical protein
MCMQGSLLAAGGWPQGAARSLGLSRGAVRGEAALAVAQRVGPCAEPRGVHPALGAQNARLLLKTVSWLTGVLPEG